MKLIILTLAAAPLLAIAAATPQYPATQKGEVVDDYFGTKDDSFPAIAAHRRALVGESITYEQEWMGLTFHTHVEPLRNEAGQIIGTIGIAIERTPYQRERAPEPKREGRLEST